MFEKEAEELIGEKVITVSGENHLWRLNYE